MDKEELDAQYWAWVEDEFDRDFGRNFFAEDVPSLSDQEMDDQF